MWKNLYNLELALPSIIIKIVYSVLILFSHETLNLFKDISRILLSKFCETEKYFISILVSVPHKLVEFSWDIINHY